MNTKGSDREQQNVEQELRALKQRLDIVLDTVSDVFWTMDLDGRFTDVSSSVERLLGYTREEFLRKDLSELLTPECYANVRIVLERSSALARSGKLDRHRAGHLVLDEQHVRKNGSVVWTEVTNHFLFDEGGEPVGYVGVIRDVTERRRSGARIRALTEELEHRVFQRTEELRGKEEELRHAQKMEAVGRLAGGVAHDFNNLLAVIQSYATMLVEETSSPEETEESLREIIAATERGAELTKQLLAISLRQPLKPRHVDLNELVAQTHRVLARLLGEDIEVVVELESDMRRVLVDYQHMQQVLLNLAVNARDAMERGGRLTIRTASSTAENMPPGRFEAFDGGPFALLSVADTGSGMDPEVLSQIFDPFFTTKGRGKGTGLGLSTAYGIVKQSGGDISVRSRPGEGTVFDIYLPASMKAETSQREVPIVKPLPRRARTILLVEDEEPVRVVARRILERDGHRVLEAALPEVAIRLCEEHPGPIHLMLTDVVMPRMNGLQLSSLAVEVRPELKIVLMSGYADASQEELERSGKALTFISKPFTPEQLRKVVRAELALD
ncbi:MAG: ATP-binding protein [bacterium]